MMHNIIIQEMHNECGEYAQFERSRCTISAVAVLYLVRNIHFISVLRKANGMTQKDLAAKLNVSDKAVSRWENDESYPDLMLVPVIAEIFGITADELLTGERNKDTEEPVTKTSKNIQLLLKHFEADFKNKIYISLGIAAFGVVLALIINFAILQSFLAFGIATLFSVVAFVCHTIFANEALTTAKSYDEDNRLIADYERHIKDKINLVYAVIFSAVIFCIPPAVVGGSGYGLNFAEWIYPGIAVTLAYYFILIIVNSVFCFKTKKYEFADKQKYNAKLKIKTVSVFCIVVAVSVVAILVLNNQCTFVKGTQFQTQAEFVKFMTTYKNESETEFDEDYEDCVRSSDGNIIFSYPLNDNVVSIEWNESGSDLLENYFPCTVYTDEDWEVRGNIVDTINVVFVFIFVIEAVAPIIIYVKKRQK